MLSLHRYIVAAVAAALPLFAAVPIERAAADVALAIGQTSRGVARDGVAYGYAVVKSDGDQARRSALKWCKDFKDAPEPAKKCKTVSSISEGCIVVAMDPKPGTPGIGWSASGDVDAAVDEAVAACREVSPKNRHKSCVVDTLACDYRDHQKTIDGYTRGIELLPSKQLVHRSRGYHHLFMGNFDDAARDLARAVEITPQHYAILNLYVAQARAGDIGANEALESNMAKLDNEGWPYEVMKLMLSKSDVKRVRAAASGSGEECEAHFYIGEFYLIAGDESNAEGELKQAAEQCPETFDEYYAAKGELERLKR
ncbi:MAG: DUF4189 domain-containing protein [Hyphomicrobiaceae bacterium]